VRWKSVDNFGADLQKSWGFTDVFELFDKVLNGRDVGHGVMAWTTRGAQIKKKWFAV
jgi:hypothetical protein